MSDPFAPKSSEDMSRLVRDHPLAMLVSQGRSGFMATPLPLVAETDGDGRIVALIGHFARRNPHVADLHEDSRAIAIFQGPESYVSPTIVSKPGWGPTWNYAVARFQIDVRFMEDKADEALAILARALEGDAASAWKPRDMGARYDVLAKHIVAFRAAVHAVDATFKLGQDEDDATFAEIIDGIRNPELERMMMAQRGT